MVGNIRHHLIGRAETKFSHGYRKYIYLLDSYVAMVQKTLTQERCEMSINLYRHHLMYQGLQLRRQRPEACTNFQNRIVGCEVGGVENTAIHLVGNEKILSSPWVRKNVAFPQQCSHFGLCSHQPNHKISRS